MIFSLLSFLILFSEGQPSNTVEAPSIEESSENNSPAKIENSQVDSDPSEKEDALVTFIFEGVLLERGTRKPLSDVNIFILPAKQKATSDAKGKFLFPQAPTGTFEIVVNNSGYRKLNLTTSDSEVPKQLFLEKENYDLFETTVTGLGKKKDVAIKKLSQQEVLLSPGTQGDPVKAVQNLPGVANQGISSAIVIQGAEQDETRFTLNGHEIPLVFHFGNYTSILPPQAVETTELLASGFGPEYGRALGGLVNLKSAAPKSDRWRGLGYLDIYNSGVWASGPVTKKSSLMVSGRYSYASLIFKAAANNREGFDLTVAPTFSDIYADYRYQVSDKDELSFSYIRSKDVLSFALDSPAETNPSARGSFDQETNFDRWIMGWKRKVNSTDEVSASVAYGNNDFFIDIGENFFNLDTETLSLRSEYKNKISDLYTGYLGIDSQMVKFNIRLRLPDQNQDGSGSPGVRLTNTTGTNFESAVYWRNQFFIGDKWILSPNLRLGHFSIIDSFALQPRVSASYSLSDTTTLSLATGLYSQPPQNGEGSEDSGNPNLNPEKAIHINLGLQKDFRKGGSNGFWLQSEAFYKNLSDLIINSPIVDERNRPLLYSNEGSGEIYGLQNQMKYFRGDFTFVANYTFLVSQRSEPGLGTYPSNFDQTHSLNLIGRYKYRRWTFTSRLRWVTGNPFTPSLGGTFDSDLDLFIPNRGPINSDRFRDFFQFDLRVDRKWVFNNWILYFYLDVQNVTNRKNVENIRYDFDFENFQEISGLPIFPIFGLRGEF